MIRSSLHLVALLLLALWLPATQHCNLDAIGWLAEADACPAAGHCPGQHSHADCTGDNCQLVETATCSVQAASLQLAAPLAPAFTFAHGLPLPAAAPQPPVSSRRTNAPPELAPSWRFIARAVSPARAPALIS